MVIHQLKLITGYELPDSTVIDKPMLQKCFILHELPTMAANTDLVFQATTNSLWGTLGEMRRADANVWAEIPAKISGPLKQVFLQTGRLCFVICLVLSLL